MVKSYCLQSKYEILAAFVPAFLHCFCLESERHAQTMCLLQPFDAAASIVDGSLLGASETTYVGGAMLINTAITMAIFLPLTRWQPGLTSVWVGMKVMTLGRIISGSLRIRSPRSRFNFVAA